VWEHDRERAGALAGSDARRRQGRVSSTGQEQTLQTILAPGFGGRSPPGTALLSSDPVRSPTSSTSSSTSPHDGHTSMAMISFL
jgi:hypothetical protein